MVYFEKFKQIALAFEETIELPHFHKQSYRVDNKIFATYDPKNNQASVKLTEIDQDVFSKFDPISVYPAPNKWGKQGWTIIDLNNVREDILTDILTMAYYNVAPKRLIAKYKA